MTSISRKLLEGTTKLCCPFVVILMFGCEESSNDLHEHIGKNVAEKYALISQSNVANDSLFLILPDSIPNINYDVPFKINKNCLYVLSGNNIIVVYKMINYQRTFTPFKCIQLPQNTEHISDFTIINKKTVLISTMQSLVLKFNIVNRHVDTLFNEGHYVYNLMPYIGSTPTLIDNHFLLPYIKIDDFEKGNFLSVYDKNFKYVKGIGNSGFMKQKCKLPYYNTPIISNIFSNNEFYCSYSSQDQIVKCKINDDLDIIYETVYETHSTDLKKDCIPENKLYNYKYLNELYVTTNYWLRLVATDEKIFRIKKLDQLFISKESRKKNSMLDAPWLLDVIDIKSKSIKRRTFKHGEFMYLSGFLYNDLYYIPTKNCVDKITLYGYN